MNTAQRRTEILKLLQQEEKPVAARAMASQFGVSRQVIVQDMAVIRASTPGILSTTRGYVLQQDKDIACTREFKVRHGQEHAAEELNLIVDCGGRVKNISISHRVYGRVTAEMDIRSRQDVNEFVQAINSSHSSVLSSATSDRSIKSFRCSLNTFAARLTASSGSNVPFVYTSNVSLSKSVICPTRVFSTVRFTRSTGV